MKDLDPLQMYRPAQLAALLGVHKITLYKWLRSGHLPPPVKIGPITVAWRASDIQAWLQKQEDTAA